MAGTSRPVSHEMLKELILEGQNRFFDTEPCEGLHITDGDIAQLCAELKATAVNNTLEEKDKLAIKEVTPNVLRTWGVLTERDGKLVPTNAFALLTGFAYALQWSVSKVKYYLKKLKDAGLLRRIGNARKGYWEVQK